MTHKIKKMSLWEAKTKEQSWERWRRRSRLEVFHTSAGAADNACSASTRANTGHLSVLTPGNLNKACQMVDNNRKSECQGYVQWPWAKMRLLLRLKSSSQNNKRNLIAATETRRCSQFYFAHVKARRSHFPHLELGFEPVSNPWNMFVEVMVLLVEAFKFAKTTSSVCQLDARLLPLRARAQPDSRVRNFSPPDPDTEEADWLPAGLLSGGGRSFPHTAQPSGKDRWSRTMSKRQNPGSDAFWQQWLIYTIVTSM